MKINGWDVLLTIGAIDASIANAINYSAIGTDVNIYLGVFLSFLMYVPAIIIQHKWYYYHKNGDSKRIKILLWLAFGLTIAIANELSARIVGGFDYFYYFSNFKYDFAVCELLVITIGAYGYYMYLNMKEKN